MYIYTKHIGLVKGLARESMHSVIFLGFLLRGYSSSLSFSGFCVTILVCGGCRVVFPEIGDIHVMKNPLGTRGSLAGLCATAAIASGLAFIVPGAFADSTPAPGAPGQPGPARTVDVGGVLVVCGPNGPTVSGLVAAGGFGDVCGPVPAPTVAPNPSSVPTHSPHTIPPLPAPGDYQVSLSISGPKGEKVDLKNLKVGEKITLSATVTRDTPTVPTIPTVFPTPTTGGTTSGTTGGSSRPTSPSTQDPAQPLQPLPLPTTSSASCGPTDLVDPEGNCVLTTTSPATSAGAVGSTTQSATSTPTTTPANAPSISTGRLPQALPRGGFGGAFALSAIKAEPISGGTVSFFIGSDSVATVSLDEGKASAVVTLKKEGTFTVSALYTDPQGLQSKAEQSVTVVPSTGRLAYTGLDLGWGIFGLGTLAVAVGAGAYVFARRRNNSSSDGEGVVL
ncbi:unknown [Tropheryma whipplei str. Twist]|uniref:Bacterial Ig-like domain-containing protein n=1 Tax=Tropheryma whipplei (strain Twist) TaxID=203267 RepID=Q83FT5_TROWT|nr:unknown [Tropheryma whipplei str. Twist]